MMFDYKEFKDIFKRHLIEQGYTFVYYDDNNEELCLDYAPEILRNVTLPLTAPIWNWFDINGKIDISCFTIVDSNGSLTHKISLALIVNNLNLDNDKIVYDLIEQCPDNVADYSQAYSSFGLLDSFSTQWFLVDAFVTGYLDFEWADTHEMQINIIKEIVDNNIPLHFLDIDSVSFKTCNYKKTIAVTTLYSRKILLILPYGETFGDYEDIRLTFPKSASEMLLSAYNKKVIKIV